MEVRVCGWRMRQSLLLHTVIHGTELYTPHFFPKSALPQSTPYCHHCRKNPDSKTEHGDISEKKVFCVPQLPICPFRIQRQHHCQYYYIQAAKQPGKFIPILHFQSVCFPGISWQPSRRPSLSAAVKGIAAFSSSNPSLLFVEKLFLLTAFSVILAILSGLLS